MSTHEAEGGQPITMSLGVGLSMEMIWCPPGEFYMGSVVDDPYAEPDDQPRHLVRITRDFYMARTHDAGSLGGGDGGGSVAIVRTDSRYLLHIALQESKEHLP